MKLPLTGDSARRSQQTLTIRLGLSYWHPPSTEDYANHIKDIPSVCSHCNYSFSLPFPPAFTSLLGEKVTGIVLVCCLVITSKWNIVVLSRFCPEKRDL